MARKRSKAYRARRAIRHAARIQRRTNKRMEEMTKAATLYDFAVLPIGGV